MVEWMKVWIMNREWMNDYIHEYTFSVYLVGNVNFPRSRFWIPPGRFLFVYRYLDNWYSKRYWFLLNMQLMSSNFYLSLYLLIHRWHYFYIIIIVLLYMELSVWNFRWFCLIVYGLSLRWSRLYHEIVGSNPVWLQIFDQISSLSFLSLKYHSGKWM